MTVVALWVLLGGSLAGFGGLDREQSQAVPADLPVQPPLQQVAGLTSARQAVGAGVLHLVNRIAMASGRIAVRRARRADVRAFAAGVMAEHERVEGRLQAWLAEHRVAEHLLKGASPQGSADQLRIPDRLRRTPPRTFDRTFLKAIVATAKRSQRFLAAFRAGSQPGDDELGRLLEHVSALLLREQASALHLLGGAIERPRTPPQQPPAAAPPRS